MGASNPATPDPSPSHCARADVLLTGATSQIGRFLLPRLTQAGLHVEAWSRKPAGMVPGWQRRDIEHACGPLPAATLLHLAPLWLLPPLLQGSQAQALRIVAIGSCSISAKANWPSLAERTLALRLQEAEQRLAELAARQGHSLTILRPTMLYGAGLDDTIAPMQRFIRRWRFLPFPTLGFGLRQPVHVEDVADAVMACLGENASIGRTYELGGGERLRLDEIARRLFTDNGLSARLLPIPKGVLAGLIRLRHLLSRNSQWDAALLDRARLDQVAENSAAARDFGYSPRRFDGRFP